MNASVGQITQGVAAAGSRRMLYVLAAVGILLLLVPVFGYQPLIINTTDTLILALLVLSLNLLVGYGGMISMGHAAFFATGGYTAGLLAKFLDTPFLVAFAAGPLAAAILAAIIGALCVRLSHAYFIMLTLAFAQLVYTVIWKWRGLTGGDDGLIGFSPPTFLLNNAVYYYFTLAVVATCIYALYRICESPFGRTLTAIRDNPDRATFIGVNVRAKQWTAFVIAGFFAGVAGVLQAYFHRGMFVNAAHFITSADALVILLLGGSRWFVGPLIGAVVFKILFISIPTITVYWPLFIGLVILAVALFMPDGLAKFGDILRPKAIARERKRA